jgi:hypothetical protein
MTPFQKSLAAFIEREADKYTANDTSHSAVAAYRGHKAGAQSLSVLLEKSVEEIKSASRAVDLTATTITEIIELAYPGMDGSCECEYACECKFPEGYLKLKDLKYHCYGTSIGIDETLAEIESALHSGREGEKDE